jgi:GPH family glycoside/pentoside/hexuronide:cation symporter
VSVANERRIGGARLIAFASITVPMAALELPLMVYVPPLYAASFGVPLATLGFVFLICRLWDALIDPLVGSWSDRTRSPFGRRRPFIAIGGIIVAAATVPLFFPFTEVINPWVLGATLFVLYFGYTLVSIPFLAWSGELSSQYHERTRIVAYGAVTTSIALLITLILPTIIDNFAPGNPRLKLAAMGGLVLVTLLPALILTLRAVPEAQVFAKPETRMDPRQALKLILQNRLLVRVLASNFAVRAAQSIRAALIVFFVSSYMGLPQWAAGLFLFQFVIGIFAGPLWLKIGQRVGKHRAAVTGEISQIFINLALLLVMPGNLTLLLVLAFAQGLAQGSGNLMLRAIVADVADKAELDTGYNRTGLYFSVFSLSDKAAAAIAVGIALPLIGWLGFNAQGTNTPEALDRLKYVFALGPALAHLASALLIYRFPLGEAAHRTIRDALESRASLSPFALQPAE